MLFSYDKRVYELCISYLYTMYVIWLSNIVALNVSEEGYSRDVPEEGYSRNAPEEGYSRDVPEEGYSRNVPEEGYSRNALCSLNLISTFLYTC